MFPRPDEGADIIHMPRERLKPKQGERRGESSRW